MPSDMIFNDQLMQVFIKQHEDETGHTVKQTEDTVVCQGCNKFAYQRYHGELPGGDE
jgi:hypothetical protein